MSILMKISVLTILILMLMAGLAMVQMDANTENHIQVLSETEMLTTQGASSVSQCRKLVVYRDGQPGPRSEKCNSKDCWTEWNGLGWSSFKQIGEGYDWCGMLFNANFDCIIYTHPDDVDPDNPPLKVGTQECALRKEYLGPYCIGWFVRPGGWIVTAEYVKIKKRAAPCVVNVGVGSSS